MNPLFFWYELGATHGIYTWVEYTPSGGGGVKGGGDPGDMWRSAARLVADDNFKEKLREGGVVKAVQA